MARFILTMVGTWGLFAAPAILIAALRERLLEPFLGHELTLSISGVILSLLGSLVTLAQIPKLRGTLTPNCWLIGGGGRALSTLAKGAFSVLREKNKSHIMGLNLIQ
jgi:hypothetical protein